MQVGRVEMAFLAVRPPSPPHPHYPFLPPRYPCQGGLALAMKLPTLTKAALPCRHRGPQDEKRPVAFSGLSLSSVFQEQVHFGTGTPFWGLPLNKHCLVTMKLDLEN